MRLHAPWRAVRLIRVEAGGDDEQGRQTQGDAGQLPAHRQGFIAGRGRERFGFLVLL